MLDKVFRGVKGRLTGGKGSFFRHVLTMMTGTAFAQVITLAASFVLARLFNPDDFGVLAVYLSITSVLSMVASLRYELAIVLPKEEEDAANLLGLSLLLCAVTALFSSVIIAIFGDDLVAYFGLELIAPWLWLVPITNLFMGAYMALNYWSTRKKQFKRLAISRVAQNSVIATAQMGSGFFKSLSGLGLVGGHILGQFTAAFVLAFQIWREDWPLIKKSISWAKIKELALKYKKFPLYNSWTTLLNSWSIQMPVFFLTIGFGEYKTGFFSMAMRITNLPLSFIGSAVGQVFLPELASRLKEKGDVSAMVRKAVLNMLVLGIGLVGIMQFAPFLFKTFLTAKWETAGVYASIMAVSVAMRFVVSPLSGVLIACDQQHVLARWQVAYSITTFLTLWFSISQGDIFTTLYSIVINDVVMYSIYLYLILRASSSSRAKVSSVE